MAFLFKIKIDGSQKPPIWRKVKVNEDFTFDEFHAVIQILFGLCGMARLMRFIPQPVMTGFVNALGILIFFGKKLILRKCSPKCEKSFFRFLMIS